MKKRTVDLDGFKVEVKELTLRDIKKAVSNLTGILRDENLDLELLLKEKYDDVLDIAGGFLAVSDGMSLEDLTPSDLEKIIPVFKEVNSSFLSLMVAENVTEQVQKTATQTGTAIGETSNED